MGFLGYYLVFPCPVREPGFLPQIITSVSSKPPSSVYVYSYLLYAIKQPELFEQEVVSGRQAWRVEHPFARPNNPHIA